MLRVLGSCAPNRAVFTGAYRRVAQLLPCLPVAPHAALAAKIDVSAPKAAIPHERTSCESPSAFLEEVDPNTMLAPASCMSNCSLYYSARVWLQSERAFVGNEEDALHVYCEYPEGKVFVGTLAEHRKRYRVFVCEEDGLEYNEIGKRFLPRPLWFHNRVAELAREGVDRLFEASVNTEWSWEVWEQKKNYKIETLKFPKKRERLLSRITYEFETPPPAPCGAEFTMDFVADALWQEDFKQRYDPQSENIFCFFELDSQTNVSCQVFKSRFGISGRDFVLTLRRERRDDARHERLLIGGSGIPPEVDVLAYFDRPEVRREYERAVAKTVRGKLFTAGFYVEHERGSAVWKLVYVNDIDAISGAVPQWIVNRVKIDQLKTVFDIPAQISRLLAETGGKIEPQPYVGEKRIIDGVRA